MTTKKEKVLLAITTAPKGKYDIFRMLIKENIVACISLIKDVKSIYIFNEQYCEEDECFAIMKLKESKKDDLKKTFLEHHPYEVPELLFFEAKDGLDKYIKFVLEK